MPWPTGLTIDRESGTVTVHFTSLGRTREQRARDRWERRQRDRDAEIARMMAALR